MQGKIPNYIKRAKAAQKEFLGRIQQSMHEDTRLNDYVLAFAFLYGFDNDSGYLRESALFLQDIAAAVASREALLHVEHEAHQESAKRWLRGIKTTAVVVDKQFEESLIRYLGKIFPEEVKNYLTFEQKTRSERKSANAEFEHSDHEGEKGLLQSIEASPSGKTKDYQDTSKQLRERRVEGLNAEEYVELLHIYNEGLWDPGVLQSIIPSASRQLCPSYFSSLSSKLSGKILLYCLQKALTKVTCEYYCNKGEYSQIVSAQVRAIKLATRFQIEDIVELAFQKFSAEFQQLQPAVKAILKRKELPADDLDAVWGSSLKLRELFVERVKTIRAIEAGRRPSSQYGRLLAEEGLDMERQAFSRFIFKVRGEHGGKAQKRKRLLSLQSQ